MKWRISALSAILVAVPAAAAFAQDSSNAPTIATSSAKVSSTSASASKLPLPKFSKADKNGDGWIEWREAEAAGVPKSLFDEESHEQKGRLTMTEWQLTTLAMIKPVSSKPPTQSAPKPASAAAPPKPASKTPPPGTGSGGG